MIENWDRYKDLEYYPDRVCACGCGGRIKVQPHHKYHGIPKYIYGHGKKNRQFLPRETRICAAPNCDIIFEVIITSKKRYCCGGHGSRGNHHSEETIEKIRQAKLGKYPTEETKEKQRQAKLGKPSGMLNKHHSEETKVVMKKSRREGLESGRIIPPMLGKHHSEESKEKSRKTHEQLWQEPEYREKRLKAIFKGFKLLPNKPEKFLIKLLQELFPSQWKFVGDGKFWINGKNPDFVHISQKKIIEHFGDYHHGEGVTGISNKHHEQERIDLFAKKGFQTLVIWQHELENIELLTKKVIQFNSKGTLANEEITPDMELLPSSAK